MLRRRGQKKERRLRLDAVFMLYLYVQRLRISDLCTYHCIYFNLIAETERPEKRV